jgi:Putative rhamnosyl transferase
MLIATRLGIGIKDPAWFRHRLALLSTITAPSLLAQDDQGFEWAICADAEIPSDVREELEGILIQFDGRAFIDLNGHNEANLMALADDRGLVSSDGYVFTGRIDDDDAWDRGTVSAVRGRLKSWCDRDDLKVGFGMTFETGLVWVMYDIVDIPALQQISETTNHKSSVRPFTHPFTSISGFVYSPRAEGLTSISAAHSKIPELLTERGFQVEWVATERPMWLYCRHKQTTSVVGRALEAASLDLSLGDLGAQFGIDEARTSQYIDDAINYDYSWIGHWEYRNKVRAELRALSSKIRDPLTSEADRPALVSDHMRLTEEFKRASADVMFRPEAGVAPD